MDNTDLVLILGYCEIMNTVYKVASETEEFDPLTIAVIGIDFNGCVDENNNMNGFWYLANKIRPGDTSDFYSDFDDGKWDFSPYVNYPFGSAIPDPAHGEELERFRTAMGGESYTAVPNLYEADKDYYGYIYDSILLYLTAMDNLLTDTNVGYFADGDDAPDLNLGLANAYIRSTVLNDGVSGSVSLDSNGERRGEISLRSVNHTKGDYKEIEVAIFNPADINIPFDWMIEQNEVVWAFGKTRKDSKNDKEKGLKPPGGSELAFKLGLASLTAFVTVLATVLLYKVQKNAAIAQIDSAKSIETAAESLAKNAAQTRKGSTIGNEKMNQMSSATLGLTQLELELRRAKLDLDIERSKKLQKSREKDGGNYAVEP